MHGPATQAYHGDDHFPRAATSVSVALAFVREVVPEYPPAVRREKGGDHMPTVLVVDDDPGIRKILVGILSVEGYPTLTANSGGPALKILLSSPEGMVVLLGLSMPYLDGQDVLEVVARTEDLAARHVFIMVTGSVERARTGRVAELRDRLGVPLVAKPFSFEEIVEAVEVAAADLRG